MPPGLCGHDGTTACSGNDFQTVETEAATGFHVGRPVWSRGGRGGVHQTAILHRTITIKKRKIQTDWSDAFICVRRTAILPEVAKSIPGMTPFVAKLCDRIPVTAVNEMDSGAVGQSSVQQAVMTTDKPDQLAPIGEAKAPKGGIQSKHG